MEEVKAEEVEKMYMIHWSCPHCGISNTHEDESSRDMQTLECWECEEQTNVEWQY